MISATTVGSALTSATSTFDPATMLVLSAERGRSDGTPIRLCCTTAVAARGAKTRAPAHDEVADIGTYISPVSPDDRLPAALVKFHARACGISRACVKHESKRPCPALSFLAVVSSREFSATRLCAVTTLHTRFGDYSTGTLNILVIVWITVRAMRKPRRIVWRCGEKGSASENLEAETDNRRPSRSPKTCGIQRDKLVARHFTVAVRVLLLFSHI